MNDFEKESLVKQAFKRAKLPPDSDVGKGCVYLSYAMADVLQRHGEYAIVLAGSVQFLAVPDELDDGKSPTHYSYIYTPTPFWMTLPELHAWVITSDGRTVQIIDLTTEHLPRLSNSMGLQWRAPNPPKYLWCDIDKLPTGWVYTPDQHATSCLRAVVKGINHR